MSALAAITPLWLTARAAGIGALLSASGALAAGLLMALRLPRLRPRAIELRAAHEALAIATFVLLLLHATTLLLDPVLKPGLVGLLVPFGAAYERLGTALGQLAAYGMIGLGLTFYVRRRLGGGQRWRRAHRWIPLFWGLAVGHALLTGTDALTWWFLAAFALPVTAGVALLAERHLREDEPPPPRRRAAASERRGKALA